MPYLITFRDSTVVDTVYVVASSVKKAKKLARKYTFLKDASIYKIVKL